MTTARLRTKQIFILITTILFSLALPLKAAVVCDQLTALAPGILRFLVHPSGSILAAQDATSGGTTCISFYTFQKANTEGRPAKLTLLSQLEDETGQGIVYDWAKTKRYFAFGTPQGKIAAYEIPEEEEGSEPNAPILLGTKNKTGPIKAIAWSNDGEHFASIVGEKLTMYSINPESKKHPIKRVTSAVTTLEEITFLHWSHDDGFIVAGNSNELAFWRTRTPSGNLKLTAYFTRELEGTLRTISGDIKDIAWNRTSSPTLAVLSNKLTLITFPTRQGTSQIATHHNFASRATCVLAWNATTKACQPGLQELIASELTGRTYQVYTMTDKSLMLDTTQRDLLPPFNRSTGIPGTHGKLQSSPTQRHDLSEATMLELVNKLGNKPQN